MSGSSKQTSTTTIDPKLMALYQQNYQSAQNVANRPYQPYTGELVAPFNQTQQQAQGLLGNIATSSLGDTALNGAVGGAQGILGYTPQNVTAQQVGTSEVSAPQVNAGLLANTDLSPYMNPFQSSVIDQTLAQQERARQMAQVATNQQSTAENAFGGSRSGVANALTNQAYDQDTAQLVANLNAQNFGQAQSAASADIARQLAAAQANQGASLTASQANAANALTASNANASNALQAALANQNAGLTAQNLGLNASGLLGNLSQQQIQEALNKAGVLANVGSQQQQQQQNVDTSAYQQFLNQWNYPFQQQQVRNSALGIIPVQSTTTQTASQNPGLLGILGGILGAGQTAATMGAFG